MACASALNRANGNYCLFITRCSVFLITAVALGVLCTCGALGVLSWTVAGVAMGGTVVAAAILTVALRQICADQRRPVPFLGFSPSSSLSQDERSVVPSWSSGSDDSPQSSRSDDALQSSQIVSSYAESSSAPAATASTFAELDAVLIPDHRLAIVQQRYIAEAQEYTIKHQIGRVYRHLLAPLQEQLGDIRGARATRYLDSFRSVNDEDPLEYTHVSSWFVDPAARPTARNSVRT